MKPIPIFKTIFSVSTLFLINTASAAIDTSKLATYNNFLTNHGTSINKDQIKNCSFGSDQIKEVFVTNEDLRNTLNAIPNLSGDTRFHSAQLADNHKFKFIFIKENSCGALVPAVPAYQPGNNEYLTTINSIIDASDDSNIASEEGVTRSLSTNNARFLTQKNIDVENFKLTHSFSIIDPRNMVNGTIDDEPYVIVGRDAILQTTLAHSSFDPARIDAQLEKMHENGEFKLKLNHIDDNEKTINGDNKKLLSGYDPEVDLFIIRNFKSELLNDKTEDEQLLFVKEQRAKAILAEELHIQNKENLPQKTYYREKYSKDINNAFKLELLKKYKSAIAKNDDDATNKPYYNIFDFSIDRFEKKNRNTIELHHDVKDKYLNFMRDILIDDVASLLEATEITSTYSEDDIQVELATLNSSTDTDKIRQAHNILVRGGYIPKHDIHTPDANTENKFALRFLAQQEISKKIMAHELGIKPESLIVVAQPDNYINMVLQPATDGYILMNDPRTVGTFIDDIIDHADYNDINIDYLKDALADFRKNAATIIADNKKIKVYDLIKEQLDRADLTTARIPGIMESKDIKVNWINGVVLENRYNRSIFITLTADKILDQGLKRWLNYKAVKYKKFENIYVVNGNEEDKQYGYGLNSKIKMH